MSIPHGTRFSPLVYLPPCRREWGPLSAAGEGSMQPTTLHPLSGDCAEVGEQHTLQTLILLGLPLWIRHCSKQHLLSGNRNSTAGAVSWGLWWDHHCWWCALVFFTVLHGVRILTGGFELEPPAPQRGGRFRYILYCYSQLLEYCCFETGWPVAQQLCNCTCRSQTQTLQILFISWLISKG